MTIRERLIKLIQNCVDSCPRNCAEKIADFLLANGVILPPCNVGDTIYFDTFKRGEEIGIQSHKVASINVTVETERTFGSIGAEIPDWAFGKTVFLTHEEAEKALCDMKK